MFDDLADLYDPALHLPIEGRVYTVPPPPARVGLRLQALRELQVMLSLPEGEGPSRAEQDRLRRRLKLDDDQEHGLYRDSLGPAYEQMLDADVAWPHLQHAGVAAFLAWTVSRQRAEEYWRSPADPPSAPQDGAGASTSTSTDGGTTTPTPASTSGTTSHPTSRPASPSPGPPAPRGATS